METTCCVKIQLFTEHEFWAKLTLTGDVDRGGGREGVGLRPRDGTFLGPI